MRAGGDGGGAGPDEGMLEQANLRIRQLESEIVSLRSAHTGGKPGGGAADAAQLDALYAALETSQSKMLAAQAKSDALQRKVQEMEKATEEQNAVLEIEAKERREKRMRQVVGRLMGRVEANAFEAWAAAVRAGGDGGEADGGEALMRANRKIADLERSISQMMRSSDRDHQGTASIPMARDSAIDQQALDALYAEQRAVRERRDTAMQQIRTMEHQPKKIIRDSQANAIELRNQRMHFIHGRLANKDLALSFQMWATSSMNGKWKAVAAAKRKHTALKQKLSKSIAQSTSAEGNQNLRAIKEQIEAERLNIEKQEAMLLEQERLEEIERRTSSGDNTIKPEDRIENVFETRAANKKRVNSVFNRWSDGKLIRVRRIFCFVHPAKCFACTVVDQIWFVK